MKKILLLGMIAALLTFGFVLVSCNANCPGDGKCDWEKGVCFSEDDEAAWLKCIGTNSKKCGC